MSFSDDSSQRHSSHDVRPREHSECSPCDASWPRPKRWVSEKLVFVSSSIGRFSLIFISMKSKLRSILTSLLTSHCLIVFLYERNMITQAPQVNLRNALNTRNYLQFSHEGKTITERCTRSFPLMRLPPEIRNEIYRIVAHWCPNSAMIQRRGHQTNDPVTLRQPSWRLDIGYQVDPYICQPSLFMTTRQIRAEGLPFYFLCRHFTLPIYYLQWQAKGDTGYKTVLYKNPFFRWFTKIGPVGRENIRRLDVVIRCSTAGSGGIKKEALAFIIETVISNLSRQIVEVTFIMENKTGSMRLWDIGRDYHVGNPDHHPICSLLDPKTGISQELSYLQKPTIPAYHVMKLTFKNGFPGFGGAGTEGAGDGGVDNGQAGGQPDG